MLWRLIPADLIMAFNMGKAKFTVIEEHEKGRKEIEAWLYEYPRIPVKTYGWHSGFRTLEYSEPISQGPEGEEVETEGSGEDGYDWDKDTPEDLKDWPKANPQRTKEGSLSVLSFYVKKTQAYWTKVALEQGNYRILEWPPAASSPGGGRKEGAFSFTPITGSKKAMKNRKDPSWRF